MKPRNQFKPRWTPQEKKARRQRIEETYKKFKRTGNNMALNIREQLQYENAQNVNFPVMEENVYNDPSGSGVVFDNEQFHDSMVMVDGEEEGGADLRSLLNKRRFVGRSLRYMCFLSLTLFYLPGSLRTWRTMTVHPPTCFRNFFISVKQKLSYFR